MTTDYDLKRSIQDIQSGISRLDANARRIDLLIDQDEFARRRAAWKPRRRATPLAGALEKYASQVGSAHLGAVTHSGNLQWDFEEPEQP